MNQRDPVLDRLQQYAVYIIIAALAIIGTLLVLLVVAFLVAAIAHVVRGIGG